MKYTIGGLKRIFAVTFEHGESVVENLIGLIRREGVRNGYIFFLGALAEAKVVTGPRDLTLPTAPMWGDFADGREIVGVGSIAWDDDETPRVHLHTVAGRGGDVFVGCLRERGIVHIVVEAVIFETELKDVRREFDPALGAHIPSHG
ncbi:MAG TPA: DNA-binding protein [bacterium]|nr:DNA-binding protein [bacterium]